MIILKNSSNVIQYTFPASIALVDEPWNKRLETEDRAYQAGGVLVSDEKVATRIISLHGIFGKDNQTLMEAELRSMKKAVYTEDLRLYSTQFADDFYNVECLNFEHTFLGPLTIVEINIDFLISDPFRYYKDETTDTKNPVISGTPYTVTNNGDVEVEPIITYVAGGAQTKIKIENANDGNKYFEYTTSIALNDSIVFDFQEGTVEKNGTSDINNFSGAFYKLASGANSITITVTGVLGTSTLEHKFRQKYL